ncbi:MAG: hypothetical protein OXT68_03780 [Chloroflexota bacterium]|nr:hypothetical protein [Chloroflexota bacterium]MDE2949865.1 hypothetical protein [Chloroflexota bacterium]
MIASQSLSPEDDGDQNNQYVFSILKAAMALPGAKVDRASFLRAQLKSHCADKQVKDAVKTNPAQANVRDDIIDRIADSVIKSHNRKAAAGSFVTGIPGGLALALTFPADTVNFIWHAVVLAQKLAYLYVWPDLLQEDSEIDEETQYRIVLLVGSMLGIGEANQLLTRIAKKFAGVVVHKLPKYALTKTAYYPIVKTVLKWVGIKLTKQSYAKGVSKLIPLASGAIGAGMTSVALRRMARNLKNHLKTLEYAKPCSDRKPPDGGASDQCNDDKPSEDRT